MPKLLELRKQSSQERLQEFRRRVSAIPELRTLRDLSIYVTGSYGRLEAHERSDLDLFFISNRDVPIDRTAKILIDAQLIRIARDMGFPPFSNDAQYLQIHSLNEMLDKLGTAEDDSRNFFTARLLLLLESRSVHDEAAYRTILKGIIDAYFRDYHDHTRNFRPLFLVNDILRFWKTLCLNYESKRNPPAARADKNKHHLRNLKLKFSRLLICFSTVIPLAAARSSSPGEVLELTTLPPIERLRKRIRGEKQGKLYNRLVELYASFLELTARPDIADRMGERAYRRRAFAKADEFGDTMFSLLRSSLKNPDDLRFLIT